MHQRQSQDRGRRRAVALVIGLVAVTLTVIGGTSNSAAGTVPNNYVDELLRAVPQASALA